jgi:hypothetical protein
MSYLEGKYTAAKYGSCIVREYERLIKEGYNPQEALSQLDIL